MLKARCRRADTNLFVVLWVGAATVTIQQSVLPPYLRVTTVAGTDPAQELLQFGPDSFRRLTLAVCQVFNDCLYQDLENLPREEEMIHMSIARFSTAKETSSHKENKTN